MSMEGKSIRRTRIWHQDRLESSLKFRGGEGKVLRGGYLGGTTPLNWHQGIL